MSQDYTTDDYRLTEIRTKQGMTIPIRIHKDIYPHRHTLLKNFENITQVELRNVDTIYIENKITQAIKNVEHVKTMYPKLKPLHIHFRIHILKEFNEEIIFAVMR